MNEIISTKNAPSAIGPYSQAVKAGNLLFISGQIPLDPATGEVVEATIQAQTTRSLNNLRSVVKTTVFLKSMDDFAEMNKVYQQFFQSDCPARSAVQVAKLPKDVMVEIEAIAAL